MLINLAGVEFWAIYTPSLIAILALGAMLLDLTAFRRNPAAVGKFVLAGIGLILGLQFYLHAFRLNLAPSPSVTFKGQLFFDIYSIYFNYLFLLAAGAGVIFSLLHFRGRPEHRAEYYVILLMATVGMCLMASAADLLLLFIGLETMSISVYLLAASEKRDARSGEASIKYLLLGSLASAIFLYGLALIYGTTGVISFRELTASIDDIFQARQIPRVILTIGILMTLVGLFFKVAAVPFHMWTPDAYEGAPTPITAVMATGIKAAAFAALLRLCLTAFSSLWGSISFYSVFYAVAVATMLLGNFVAVGQKNVKRMLAYSSIAHAGYMMIALTAIFAAGQFIAYGPDDTGMSTLAHGHQAAMSVLYYLLIYTLMNLPAFGVITIVALEKSDGETLAGLSGLAGRRPALAAVMAICMLSLAGVPPLAGFGAKLFVFQAAVGNRLYVLAIIGVLASVVSAYYYLRVIYVMYMQPASDSRVTDSGYSMTHFASGLFAAAVVLIGLFPMPVLQVIYKTFDAVMVNSPLH